MHPLATKIFNYVSGLLTNDNEFSKAIEAQTHIGIISIHNTTGLFERDFQCSGNAEDPIRVSAKNAISFFRADYKEANQQAAYFNAINNAIGMNAVIIMTGECSNHDELELAKQVKTLMPDMPVIMAYPLFAANEILPENELADIKEKDTGHNATLVATKDSTIFTSQIFSGDGPVEITNPQITIPDNVDVIILSNAPSKSLIEYMDLTTRNPYAPTDKQEAYRWGYDLVRTYESISAVKQAIYDMEHNILEHRPKEFSIFSV